MIKILIIFYSLICSGFFVYFFNNTISLFSIGYSIELIIFSYFFYRAIKSKAKSTKEIIALSILFSIFLVLGKQLIVYHHVKLNDIATYLSLIIMAYLFSLLLTYIKTIHLNFKFLKEFSDNKYIKNLCDSFIARTTFIFFCWIPIWLSAYPGFFCYDAYSQYYQLANGQISMHHPPFHTIIMGGIIGVVHKFFGSYNLGIALYILLQMIVISMIFSYALGVFYQYNKNISLKFTLLLYYALFPVVSIFSQCSTKDALFNAFVFLFFIMSLNVLSGKYNRKYLGIYFCVGLIMVAFRNNAIYALIVWIIILFLYSKTKQKKLIIILLLIVVANFGYKQVLTQVFHFQETGIGEMLSVPLQQLARVYRDNNNYYTEEDLDFIYSFMDEESFQKKYVPVVSDPIKNSVDNYAIKANPAKFLALYLKTGLNNISIYIDSFLENTYYAWYPDSVIDGYNIFHATRDNTIYQVGGKSYFAADVELPGELNSKIPFLYDLIVQFSREINFEKIPFLSLLFSIGFMNWIVIITFAVAIKKQDYNMALILGFILLLLCTLLLGPMVLVRYYLISFYLFPILVYYIFNERGILGE